jgi:hypothetical protein
VVQAAAQYDPKQTNLGEIVRELLPDPPPVYDPEEYWSPMDPPGSNGASNGGG